MASKSLKTPDLGDILKKLAAKLEWRSVELGALVGKEFCLAILG